ncbi:MAG TPA: cellulase family glycosylhydrolase [Chloroflexota bacterium]|nr:cellulase family glycosylhydrolase [Chloroflexota bacterium]
MALSGTALALDMGGTRSRLGTLLGDERRHQLITFTSRFNQRPVETADMAAIANLGGSQVGINTFLEQEVEVSKRRQSLRMIREAGIGFVRQQFPWEDIEGPAKGRFWDEKNRQSSWNKYDNIVQLANEQGLQLIVRLDLPPKWAHPSNPWPHTPPDRFEDYGNFVHTVVSRYKGKVKYYQLWNEPNLAIEWGSKPVDAAEYVRLLKIGYQRAKEADPNAVILSAALAPTVEESWQALNDQIYLQRMYDAGAEDYFDIMSVMAYGLRSGPDDRRLALRDVNFSRPILTREIMVKNGDDAKPIWASEMGWNVQPESVSAEPVFGRVTEELQARYTVRGLQRAAEEWPWMGVMNLWFFKRADEKEREQPFYYFRLVDPDFTPRPVYQAVKEYGNRAAVAQRGYSQSDHRALEYQGEWTTVAEPRASLGALSTTMDPGASARLYFSGTDLELVVARGPAMGKAYLTVDGSPAGANQLAQDDLGRAALDLSAPTQEWQQRVAVARGLSEGIHLLEIRPAGYFALDALVVDSTDIPLAKKLLAFSAGALVALLGAFMARAALSRPTRRRRYRLS